jgi:hypothetical protein
LFIAPSNSAVASKPVGQWNRFEIEVTDQKHIVTLNDKKVTTEFTGNRNTEGYIGIENHDADSRVSFKNIRIKEKNDDGINVLVGKVLIKYKAHFCLQ